jgi:hypothetical protein
MPLMKLHSDFLIHRIRKGADNHDYMIFELPDNNENRHVETPATIFNIPGVTASNLEAEPESVPCIKYHYEINRRLNPDSSGGLRGSGSNEICDLTVIIPFEPYIADIMTKQFKGIPIDEMTIKTIHWTGGDSFESLKEEKFSHCHVIEVTHSRYWTLITFHVRQVDITIFQYNQTTGAKEGQNQTTFNYVEDSPAAA